MSMFFVILNMAMKGDEAKIDLSDFRTKYVTFLLTY